MVVQIAGGIFGSLLVAGLVPGSYIGEAHLLETNPMGYNCHCLKLLLAQNSLLCCWIWRATACSCSR